MPIPTNLKRLSNSNMT